MMATKRGTRPGRLLLPLLLLPVAAPAQSRPLQGLDQFIQRSMEQWEVPGVAIAVVKGGSVVYARGYGVREVGKPDRVDEHTSFAIGSASKAFTAAAIARLVDQGKLKWDDPATKYLPGFQLFDPYVTRELTVRDLLTHRSGLLRGDALWYATDLDREEILRHARYQEPTSSFRSAFGYNNIMYLAAGEVVRVTTGRSWDDYVAEEIFRPLGMTRSTTSVDRLPQLDNVAAPHLEIDGQVRPVPYRDIDNIAPAGSIHSSVSEMANWVKLHLGGGALAGQRLLEEKSVREMHTPQMVIRREGSWALMAPESHFLAYGLGWFLHDYRGRKVVQHGGNIDGMHALVAMMPAEDLGVVILTNRNPNALTYATMYRVFDSYLGGPRKDWSEVLHGMHAAARAKEEAERKKLEEARVAGTRPSLAPGEYAGTYQDDMYGKLTVTLEGEGLVMRRGSAIVGDMEHWHYDTFRVNWRDRSMGHGYATFHLDPMGRVGGVRMRGLAEFARVREEPARPTTSTGGAPERGR